MNAQTSTRLTRGRWLALAASAALCAVVISATRYVRPVQFVGDAELVALDLRDRLVVQAVFLRDGKALDSAGRWW